jgi:hypothetical protein
VRGYDRLSEVELSLMRLDEVGLRFDEVGLRLVLLNEAGWGLYMVVWGCLRCDRLSAVELS